MASIIGILALVVAGLAVSASAGDQTLALAVGYALAVAAAIHLVRRSFRQDQE